MLGWTQPWLANIGYKESLKRTSTAAGTGNADVGRKVHYLTNLSLKIELKFKKNNFYWQIKLNFNDDIVPFSSSLEIYRNTRYFRHFKFCRKVRFLPLSSEFPPRKREFSFGKIENAKGILISRKRILFFEGEIPWKGVKTSLSDKI